MRLLLRLRRPVVRSVAAIARRGSLHRSSRSLVFSRPGRSKWRDSISVRLLSARRPKRSVHGCPLSPPPTSHRLRCFGQQPGTLRRQRTTSPPLGSRAPSAAESRASTTSPPLRSSRHSYAGFATSAELPTCVHAMRACARSSRCPTSPPRSMKATCRPSTFANHDDPRAHPRTLATSASGLASHRQPSDPLRG
jgi:hypothetical protein